LPDDSWAVELSEAVPAPAEWAETPNAATHLPGSAFLVALPYAIMQWFVEQVAEQVERCRIVFEQGEPEAVE